MIMMSIDNLQSHHSRKRSYSSPRELQNWHKTENFGENCTLLLWFFKSTAKLDNWNQTEIWMLISKLNCALCCG